MKLPVPSVGSIIRYSYLWADEAASGKQDGRKDRPALVLALAVVSEGGLTEVLVLAITHRPPRREHGAVALPPALQQAVGLDPEPAWIVTTEANVFSWPGPDVRPVPRRRPATTIYGEVPRSFMSAVAQSYLRNRRRELRQIRR